MDIVDILDRNLCSFCELLNRCRWWYNIPKSDMEKGKGHVCKFNKDNEKVLWVPSGVRDPGQPEKCMVYDVYHAVCHGLPNDVVHDGVVFLAGVRCLLWICVVHRETVQSNHKDYKQKAPVMGAFLCCH